MLLTKACSCWLPPSGHTLPYLLVLLIVFITVEQSRQVRLSPIALVPVRRTGETDPLPYVGKGKGAMKQGTGRIVIARALNFTSAPQMYFLLVSLFKFSPWKHPGRGRLLGVKSGTERLEVMKRCWMRGNSLFPQGADAEHEQPHK